MFIFIFFFIIFSGWAAADEPLHLRTPKNDAMDLLAPEPEAKTFPLPVPRLPKRHPWGIGLNFAGGQLRYDWTRRWATEARYQQGKASSDYGNVTAHVFGLRGYHYFWGQRRWPFYVGGEVAYTTAKPATSSYHTTGVAAGAFGGAEFYVLEWLSVNADIGPYVISLKEKQTGLSQTTLDFVLNTALIAHLF